MLLTLICILSTYLSSVNTRPALQMFCLTSDRTEVITQLRAMRADGGL